ncbi:MAG TPA: glycosyltransferase family 39 protein [Chloroflexia bacterium]|nr:glycosyltransferase family 39 protein [Chloroflexia bacterium]
MKTQRRRVSRFTPSEVSPSDGTNGANGATESEIGSQATEEILVEQSAAQAEVSENGHEATNGANGAAAAADLPQAQPTQVIPSPPPLTLPKRRRRLENDGGRPEPVHAPEETQVVSRTVISSKRVVESAPRTSPPAGWRVVLTYENLFWFGLFALAIATRLWDIGNRGIHHDESLHSVYSNNLYKGLGYTHDPMMHGPLQFHLIASMFWLFGATDATARLASAFCGIFVVMSPFFLRRQMGRLTALICSVLLLVSPSILYFSRMAREDAIFSGMEMIMIVGLWRFISMRKPADFYVFCAGLALMFTIKESAFLTVAVLAIFFLLLFAYQSGYAIMGALGVYLAAIGGVYMVVHNGMKNGSIGPLPNIPQVSPSYEMIMSFVGGLLAHPLIQFGGLLTLLFLVALAVLFNLRSRRMLETGEALPPVPRRATADGLPSRRARVRPSGHIVASGNGHSANGHAEAEMASSVAIASDIPEPTQTTVVTREETTANESSPLWDSRRLNPKPGTILSRYEPGSIPHLIGSLFSRPVVLLVGFLVAATIFITLYTVFYTDIPRGIVSGLFGSVGYWMAQQGVERGGQPWYYYFLLIPLYEPIAVFFSIVAAIFFSWRGIRWVARNRAEKHYSGGPGLTTFNVDRPVPFARFDAFLPLFLGWWLLGAVFLYSWAGEKMPWLMVHMVRPAIFLSSLFIGALVASLLARRRERIANAEVTERRDNVMLGRPVRATGAAMFSLRAGELARRTGLAPRQLAAEHGLSNTWAFESGSGSRTRSRAVPPPPPPRRRGAPAVQAAVRVQDPPWVAWSRPESRMPVVLFLSIFTLFVMSWALSMNTLVFSSKYNEWAVTWLFPVLLLALLGVFIVWVGAGRALRYFALGILTVGLLYQFRSAIMLAYHQPDVPKEMAVYVQTSPDTTRVIHELETYANLTAGGKKDLKVVYDSFTSWPMEWYLRDYNKHFVADAQVQPAADERILLLEYAKHNSDTNLMNNYVAQRYAMRWWFPEEWYKNDFIQNLNTKTTPFNEQIGAALNTTFGTLTHPEMQGTLWKYLMFREPPKPLGSEDMILFVRKDIVQQFNYAQYAPPASNSLPVETSPPPIQSNDVP